MDLQTPPPSYEAATGDPVSQNTRNPFFRNASPSAPPTHDEELVSTAITTPILPRSHRLTSRTQPNNTISHPVPRPSPQSNVILPRQEVKPTSRTCKCFFITLIIIAALSVGIVLVARRVMVHKAEQYSNKLSEQNVANIGNDYIERQKLLDEKLRKRIDDGRWNFQTFQRDD